MAMADKKERSCGFILIVEDDRATSELEVQRLQPLGLEIRQAATAEEAVGILSADTPELMLLDYSLPGTNALELLKRLKESAITVPQFLMVTGRGGETVAVESMKSGASDYIIKNSDFLENLLPAAKKALEKAALLAELEAAQAALRESEEKYRLVVDNSGEAIIVLQDGIFRFVNPATLTLLGFSEQELGATPFPSVINPADRPMVVDRYQRMQRGEIVPPHYAFRAITKAGNTIVVEITAARIAWDGRPAILALLGDVTARRKEEEALKEAAEMKSKFASMVSHELRSPLTAVILGVSIVLEEAKGLSARDRTLLGLANENAGRLVRLINNVLDFQKMKAGKMPAAILENNIGDVVLGITGAMDLLAKQKGLALITEISPGLPSAKFDKDKISQVLTNLLSNAIAHTEKGTISVRAGYECDALHVSVSDTGIGIRAEDLAKLFQPFSQLEGECGRKTGGSGLGLAISREIILAHKGEIWAESEEGKGAAFHFTLPATRGGG